MSEAFNERRLAAIILGDVVGYSRLMGADEVGTMRALKTHRNELVLPALAAYRARLVGAPGDSMLMEFASAVSAVSCAIAIQRSMLTRNAEVAPERQLRFRLGINLGDIVVDGDEIYGDGVNVAARLESLCEPGGLCISRSIEEQIRGRLQYPFADDGEHELKNIAHPVRIFRLPADFIAELPEFSLPPAPTTTPHRMVPVAATVVQRKLGPGTLLNDTYAVDALIGSGGMGEIFRGHEIHSGGAVAIKVIRPDMIDNKSAATLFYKEALVLKDINHDAVVRYYSFSFDPTLKRHYLAMEFVDGLPLSELLTEAPLSMAAITDLRQRVASGLEVAHRRGVVHRDLSSDNIIVPEREVSRAKIIDFGIARAAAIAGTVIGDGFAGKYNYVSPEQLGLAGGDVTARSDIYSFGLVLAEACLGRPLDMGGSQAEVIDKRRAVPDLTPIDARLRPLIERMLQPDPAHRPASMEEVAAWSPETPKRDTLVRPRALPVVPDARPAAPKPRAKSSAPAERWIIGSAVALVLVAGAALATYETLLPPRQHSASNGPVLTDDGAQPPAPAEPPQPTQPPPPTQTAPTQPAPAPTQSAPEQPPPSTQPGPTQPAPTQPPQPTESAPAQPVPAQTPHPAQPSEPARPAPTPPTPAQATPVQPTPVQPTSVIERVRSFLKTYDGGDCFFALPVRITERSAAIDGFSQSKTTWDAFETAFSSRFGFSPDVVGNRIWSHQCAALQFLRQAAGSGTSPVLFLTSTRVAQGQSLAGEIREAEGQALALLHVQEDGTVVDVSKNLKNDGNAQTFDLKMSRTIGSGPVPQLLIVVSSQHPMTGLNQAVPQAADRIFASILDQASKQGDHLAVGAKLFLLDQ